MTSARQAELPDPFKQSYTPFETKTQGEWLVLSDVHLPYHDKKTVELAVAEAKRRKVVGVLLNGDLLDSHEISDHERDRGVPSYVEEIDMGQEFLRWLRQQLPKARIIFKEGNHDYRVERYVFNRAPALAGLKGVNLKSFLDLAAVGVEWVADKRPVMLGKLPVLHGHEYRGGGGVNPARWLFLRTLSSCMVGHFHRASEHNERGLSQKVHGTWSTGCACNLYPKWMPLNQWVNGLAFVDVGRGGDFHVENKKVLDGRMY